MGTCWQNHKQVRFNVFSWLILACVFVQLKDSHAKALSSSAASAESKLAAAVAEKQIADAVVSRNSHPSLHQTSVNMHCRKFTS